MATDKKPQFYNKYTERRGKSSTDMDWRAELRTLLLFLGLQTLSDSSGGGLEGYAENEEEAELLIKEYWHLRNEVLRMAIDEARARKVTAEHKAEEARK